MTSGPRLTQTYLDRIVAGKRDELERLRRERPIAELRARIAAEPPPRPLEAALRHDDRRVALIAEVKRASPSKGVLMQGVEPVDLARAYARGGATAISVVTEESHFRGSAGMLHEIRVALDAAPGGERPPLLRKDFLFDPYHIDEARAFGADAVLLIAALLDEAALRALLAQARQLGMGALVEAHDEDEMRRAVEAGATMVGVNNRDLRTFEEDLGITERLARSLALSISKGAARPLLVSESAIRTPADVARVAAAGARAVLVGEALVTAPDVAAKIRELLG